MRKVLALVALLGVTGGITSGEEIQKYSFPATTEMERRDIYILNLVKKPRAVLVLCPGQNLDGRSYLGDVDWKQFAKDNRIILAAISFASPETLLNSHKGYFKADRGSGGDLLESLRKAGSGNLPILMYGFSGGAHFVNSFINWKPSSVFTFCAYSAAWWEDPSPDLTMPKGIIACGAVDSGRRDISQAFFARERAAGRTWTWLSLSNTGHEQSKVLDGFIRLYFSAMLSGPITTGEWRDVDTGKPLDEATVMKSPTLGTWFPAPEVARAWAEIRER